MSDVTMELFIDARPETVWEFWTDANRLCEWWGTHAETVPEPGGIYRVVMAEGPVMVGRYVELVPHERIVFLFGWEQGMPSVPPSSTRVEVTLTPQSGGTRLRLRHSELPDDAQAPHTEGWNAFLPRLAAAAAK